MRVLLVENDATAVTRLTLTFASAGFKAEVTDSGQEALDLLRHYEFDIVLLNLSLPNMEGRSLLSRMRAAGRTTPVLALSSVFQPAARIRAFTAGADDVVDQTIDSSELLARMGAIVRRSRGHSDAVLRVGAVALDMQQRQLVANGQTVSLSGKEFELLQLLMLRKNMVLTKDVILSHLYGEMDEPDAKIIDVFVCKIRSKLAKVGVKNVISTVWGRGYSVRDSAGEEGAKAIPLLPEPVQRQRHLVNA